MKETRKVLCESLYIGLPWAFQSVSRSNFRQCWGVNTPDPIYSLTRHRERPGRAGGRGRQPLPQQAAPRPSVRPGVQSSEPRKSILCTRNRQLATTEKRPEILKWPILDRGENLPYSRIGETSSRLPGKEGSTTTRPLRILRRFSS